MRLPLTNLRAVSALLDLTGRSAILGAQFLKKKFGLQIRQLVPDCAYIKPSTAQTVQLGIFLSVWAGTVQFKITSISVLSTRRIPENGMNWD